MSAPDEAALRQGLVDTMRAMADRGLNRGASGNVSVRFGGGMLVTPSGVTPERLSAEGMVALDAGGHSRPGALKPSSEWRMHHGLYARRQDVQAVVHCHARHCTILACAGRPIPAMHYMVAVGGKATIPLAPYATFGTDALAEGVAEALDGGAACLMANHGPDRRLHQSGAGAVHRRGGRGAGGGLLGHAGHRRPQCVERRPDGRGVRPVPRLWAGGSGAGRRDDVIAWRGVTKSFDGRTRAVDEVTLTAPDGGFLAIVGESGSGKSTLVRMLNRLVEPDAGEVLIDGTSVLDGPAPLLRRRIGYVFQAIGLFPHLSVAENSA